MLALPPRNGIFFAVLSWLHAFMVYSLLVDSIIENVYLYQQSFSLDR